MEFVKELYVLIPLIIGLCLLFPLYRMVTEF
jgi:hypothetical protein